MDEYQSTTEPQEQATGEQQSATQERMPMPSLPNAAAAQDFFSDPDKMLGMAKIAAKYRDPAAMKWLAMGHAAVRENAIEATQHLLSGDGEAAVKAFNRSGRFNDAESATKNQDGTWTLKRKSGQSITIDPNQVMASFLSPKDFAEQQYRTAALKSTNDYHQRSLDIQGKQADNQAAYQEGMLKHYERSDQSQADLREAQAESARTRFAHRLELMGVRNAAAQELANTKRGQDPQAFRTKLVEEILKSTPDADPAKVASQVDYLVRDSFTQVLPRRDGKGYDLVSTVGHEPTVIGNFPSIEEAGAAKAAFVTGKNPPATKGITTSSTSKSKGSTTPDATPQSWAQQQNDATLQALVKAGGPYAKYAQEELARRALAPAAVVSPQEVAPPRTIIPNFGQRRL